MPHAPDASVHSRLLGRRVGHAARLAFQECFGEARRARLAAPAAEARRWAAAGRSELAASSYREAVARQPGNWALLGEVSNFLTFSLRDPRAGVGVARLALALNPSCSAELWNTLGDGLFEWGRTEEAKAAYLRAASLGESDVRSRYNLAWAHQRQKDYAAALAALAQGLALDRTGEYRERLLAKQQEVLAQQAARHRQEFLLLANLVSRHGPQAEPARAAAKGENG